MKTDIINELVDENVSKTLKKLAVGSMWMPEFGWFQKTGEKELTLRVRIYRQSLDIKTYIEKIKAIVEAMDWIFIVADDVKDAGEVVVDRTNRFL